MRDSRNCLALGRLYQGRELGDVRVEFRELGAVVLVILVDGGLVFDDRFEHHAALEGDQLGEIVVRSGSRGTYPSRSH